MSTRNILYSNPIDHHSRSIKNMSIAVLLMKDRQALNVDKLPKIFPMPTNAGNWISS